MTIKRVNSFLAENIRWIAFIVALCCTVLFASNISMADELSEAIANQNQLEQDGAVSGGNAHGTNVGEPLAVPQQDFNLKNVGPDTMKKVVKNISDSLNALEKSSAIAGASDSIVSGLVLLLLAWSLVKSMFGNGFNQFIESAIHTFLMYGIVQAFLHADGIVGITNFIDSIAASFTGGSMSTLYDALDTTVDKTFGSLSSVLSMPSGNTNYKWSEFLDWINLTIFFFIQLIAKMMAGFFIVLGFVIYACNIVLSFGSIILAKAFAPIMIPFLMIPATSFIFDGWLRFFLSALLMKAVGGFFIKVSDTLVTSMTQVAESVALSSNMDGLTLISANFVVYVCLVAMAGLSAYLMTMVPGIANGLINGSAMATGFAGLGVLTNGASMRGVNRMTTVGGKGKEKNPQQKKNPPQQQQSRPPQNPQPGQPPQQRNQGGGRPSGNNNQRGTP